MPTSTGRLVAVLTFALVAGLTSLLPAADPPSVEAASRDAIVHDWMLQDHGQDVEKCFVSTDDATIEAAMVESVLAELGERDGPLRKALGQLLDDKTPGSDPRWKQLYVDACEARRAKRLAPMLDRWRQIIFTKHFNMGGQHYAYTEGQSDAQGFRIFRPGTALCLLEMDGLYGKVATLVEDADGVIRDPDVSWDAERVLFAWKKSDREDDYHLYEMDLASREIRQLTEGQGMSDFEGCYLPNGDILFNSSRCVQTVDCFWTEVSNLYTCDKNGKQMRRLGFDQVHTTCPSVMEDGRIVYTRWDYNDRGQLYPQPLFQMNADGTGQTEFYGNNSWFPTTLVHARNIPGTQKVVAIATGHHTDQRGKLIIIDPSKGRQEAEGAQLIAPVRETESVRIDRYGQDGDQFQYPYPLDETHYLVTYTPEFKGDRWMHPFGIYFMDVDGRRELLTFDEDLSSNQSIPLVARRAPNPRASLVDYRKSTGTYYVQDVHIGPGLEGVERGTIKSLRVVGLGFRAAGVGRNGNRGPAGGALVSTPVSIDNGAWDVKKILGTVPVEEDGSAYFYAPARMPVYFQLLDEKGRMVQTMRSWSTLQPGETFSCVGCHEDKNDAVPSAVLTDAMKARPRKLTAFYGPPRGFSYPKEIQPIWDKHCIACHNDRDQQPDFSQPPAEPVTSPTIRKAFSLLGETTVDERAKRHWSDSYLALTQKGKINRVVNWISAQSGPPMLPPYHSGSNKSELLTLLESGHGGAKLNREEMEKIACWIDLLVPYCGDFYEANAWSEADAKKYAHFQAKRDRMAEKEQQNIARLIALRSGKPLPPEDEAPEYRNLALNPNDVQGQPRGYPHASSNSEYRDLPQFAARCAIDGRTANTGHGPKFPSWGPDKRTDLWWKVEFGRPVEVDKLVLVIRADFPHDRHWHTATIEFSDGTKQQIKIEKTAEPQTFTFDKRTITWLRLTELVQDEPLGWCGLTEVEVWGREQ